MNKRTEILQDMIHETEVAKRYAKLGHEKLAEGDRSTALKFYDTVKCAANCAMQKHDELWNLVGEDMTGEEFEHFCEAETSYVLRYQLAKALRGEA